MKSVKALYVSGRSRGARDDPSIHSDYLGLATKKTSIQQLVAIQNFFICRDDRI